MHHCQPLRVALLVVPFMAALFFVACEKSPPPRPAGKQVKHSPSSPGPAAPPQSGVPLDAKPPSSFSILSESRVRVYALAFSSDGRFLAAGCSEGSVRVWDLRTGRVVHTLVADSAPVYSLAFSPDGRTLASGRAGTVDLWETISGRKARTLTGHNSPVNVVAFDAKGKLLASASSTVLLTNMSNGQTVRTLPGCDLAAFHPEKPLLATRAASALAPGGREIVEWNVETGEKAERWPQAAPPVALVYARGGLPLTALVEGNAVKLREVLGDKAAVALATHAAPVLHVAFDPQSARVASAAGDQSVRLSNVNGAEIVTLKSQAGPVECIAFGPDGQGLATGHPNGLIVLWDIPSRAVRARLISCDGGEWATVMPDGAYISSPAGAASVLLAAEGRRTPLDRLEWLHRPDRVLEQLGCADKRLLKTAKSEAGAYFALMGLKLDVDRPPVWALDGPAVRLEPLAVRSITPDREVKLRLDVSDARHAVAFLDLRVNGVPVSTNVPPSTDPKRIAATAPILLAPGPNVIHASAVNGRGVRSATETVDVYRHAPDVKPNYWLIAVGVSTYKDPSLIMGFPGEDAEALAGLPYLGEFGDFFKKRVGKLNVLKLINSDATVEKIRHVPDLLSKSGVEDVVVLFMAGHAVVGADGRIYFGPYGLDMASPETTGFPLAELERLLACSPARRKLVLLDLCYVGAIGQGVDLQKSSALAGVRAAGIKGEVKVYTFGRGDGPGEAEKTELRMAAARLAQADLVNDLVRRTGATVLAACSASEYSVEEKAVGNGVFAYAALECLRDLKGDFNKDRAIRVSELCAYVVSRVAELTGGQQRATAHGAPMGDDFVAAERN